MKDKDNVLRLLDEIDNMIMIFDNSVRQKTAIDLTEARTRFQTIRKKLEVITDRVSGS